MRWWIPFLLLILIAPFTPWLDLTIARYFYTPPTSEEARHFVSNALTYYIYTYGYWPVDILAGAALLLFLLSLFIPKLKKWQKPALILVIPALLGSVLITNVLLKEYWGRPRPKQVIEFGGKQEFRPFYKPNFFNQPEPSRAFPCGHCTAGFYFFALAYLGKYLNKRWLYWLGIAVTWILSIALGMTRMAQGGHFFTDVLVAALVMWLSALWAYKVMTNLKNPN